MKDSYTIRVDNKPLALPRDFVKWSEVKLWKEGAPMQFRDFAKSILENWSAYPDRMADKLRVYAEGTQDVEAFKKALTGKSFIGEVSLASTADIRDPKIDLIGALVHKIMLEPSTITEEEKLTYEYRIALNVSKKYDPDLTRQTKLDSPKEGRPTQRKTKDKSKRPG